MGKKKGTNKSKNQTSNEVLGIAAKRADWDRAWKIASLFLLCAIAIFLFAGSLPVKAAKVDMYEVVEVMEVTEEQQGGIEKDIRRIYHWLHSAPMKISFSMLHSCPDNEQKGVILGRRWLELDEDLAVSQTLGDYLYLCYGINVGVKGAL